MSKKESRSRCGERDEQTDQDHQADIDIQVARHQEWAGRRWDQRVRNGTSGADGEDVFEIVFMGTAEKRACQGNKQIENRVEEHGDRKDETATQQSDR